MGFPSFFFKRNPTSNIHLSTNIKKTKVAEIKK